MVSEKEMNENSLEQELVDKKATRDKLDKEIELIETNLDDIRIELYGEEEE